MQALPSDTTKFCKFLQWAVGSGAWCVFACLAWQDFLRELARGESWFWASAFNLVLPLLGAGAFIALAVVTIPGVIAILAFLLLKYE